MITIGITGTIGAGKGTIVEYLQTKGFKHYSAREFLLQEVRQRGLEPIRDNISATGDDLRNKHFPGYIIGELLKEAQKNNSDAIIESIRAIGEIDLLKQNAENFYLLAIDADIKLRYERIFKRGQTTDHVTFEKFIEDENKELNSQEPWKMNIKACMKQADFVIYNDGSLDDLHKQIDALLPTFEAKK